jgi:ParB-like chromosome segregation protein Spo0J
MATRNKAQKAPADASIVVRARSVESVPVDALKPYGRNARTHSESQLEQLVGTIRKLGFNDPLLVDESNMILSGHGRWEAAKRLGMTEVPCVRTVGMTDTEKRQAILAFNRIAQNAGWDNTLLSSELTALADMDIDLGVIGFEPAELDKLLNGPGDLPEMPSDFQEFDEEIATDHECPKCGYRWSGGNPKKSKQGDDE